jgi:hypothetical protein
MPDASVQELDYTFMYALGILSLLSCLISLSGAIHQTNDIAIKEKDIAKSGKSSAPPRLLAVL